jgi:hypothetical protein
LDLVDLQQKIYIYISVCNDSTRDQILTNKDRLFDIQLMEVFHQVLNKLRLTEDEFNDLLAEYTSIQEMKKLKADEDESTFVSDTHNIDEAQELHQKSVITDHVKLEHVFNEDEKSAEPFEEGKQDMHPAEAEKSEKFREQEQQEDSQVYVYSPDYELHHTKTSKHPIL